MKLTVLGSGTIFSEGRRACSGYLVESGKGLLVMDLGYGAFNNLQKVIHPSKVNIILFTHFVHVDHAVDLIAFIEERNAQMKYKGRKKEQLTILGPKGMKSFFKKILELFPWFGELSFAIKIEEFEHSQKELFGFKIKSKPVKHIGDSIAYRIEAEGKALVYSGDTAYCSEIIDLAKEADLLVLECSFAEQKNDIHLNALECGEIAQKAGAKQVLLTHFFPEAENADVFALAGKKFKGKILAAQDLMEVSV